MIPKGEHCRACIGYKWSNCQGFSRVTGENRVPLLLVGESSGRSEEKTGEPFVGAAGQVLEKALWLSGLSRSDYSISNLLRCKPPQNLLLGQPYERAALDHCRTYLNDVIAERQPLIILALGELPLRELSRDHISQELRGYVLPSIYEGVSVVGTFHPSRILRGDWHLLPVLMHDLKVAARYAQRGVPKPLAVNYNLTPTVEDVLEYLDSLQRDPSLHISYDCETSEIIGRKGPDDWRRKELIQIQFSSRVGEAIVLPYEGEFVKLSRHIMALPNIKLGWNSRLSDDLLLRANGFTIGGEAFDCMAMLSHLQPSFSSGKDAKEGDDKGTPSRLLNLQSAISFYYPYELPYKTTMRRAIGETVEVTEELWDDVRLGGAKDVDFTLRVGLKLISTLQQQNLWDGFYRYKHRLGQVLTTISDRGLPIDRTEQRKLRQRIEWHELLLDRELQAMVPLEIRPVKSYKGFPKDLRELVKAEDRWVKCCKPTEFPDLATTLGYEVNGCLIKRLPFNADSPKQVLAYITHQTELNGWPWFIPIDVDSKKPTTNKAGIESLIVTTDDAALKQIRKLKKIVDLKSYCKGKWIPDTDGHVHADFRVGATATGQTTAVDPPIQTYPKHVDPADEWLVPIVKRIKTIIKAEAGHTMVEVDARGFHARVQGHLSGDADYYRLADFDLHSYNVAHYLKLDDAHQLRYLDDDSLRRRLKEIKSAHSYERNFILKRVAFLRQFSGGAQKAASIMKVPVMEVVEIFNMMDALFKPTFKNFPASIEQRLRKTPRLTSLFGCIRYFWDGDPQQSVAFLPANSAHCHIQDALIRLYERGALDKYGAVDFVHDSVWFMCPEELVDECIAVTKEEFERPSDVLISDSLGPFFVHADASAGSSMGELRDV